MEFQLSETENTGQNGAVDVDALYPVDAGVAHVLHEDALPNFDTVRCDPVPHGPPREPRIHDRADDDREPRPHHPRVIGEQAERIRGPLALTFALAPAIAAGGATADKRFGPTAHKIECQQRENDPPAHQRGRLMNPLPLNRFRHV